MRPPVQFVCYGKPVPQGSSKGFVYKKYGKYRAAITTDNKNLKPWRQQLTQTAIEATKGPHAPENLPFPKHVPVCLGLHFFIEKPASLGKKRQYPSVKPDLSKLVRCVEDSLTGVVYFDDAQIVGYDRVRKSYGTPERCEITIQEYPTAAELFGRGIMEEAACPQSERLF